MVGSSMVVTGSGERILDVGDGLADVDAGYSGNRDDVAQLGGDDVRPLQSGEREQLGDLDLLHRAVALGDGNIFAGAQRTVEDARNRQPTEIVAVVEIGDQHLQRTVGIAGRQGNGIDDGVEQRAQILAGLIQVGRGRAQPGIGVKHRKIELIFGCVQVDEQVVDLVQHFLRTRVGTVNLVDHQDRRQLGFQRLAQHVARLRQRAFAGVNQQHHTVHHLERTLHFAAEVAVAGRVHNVDLDVVVEDGRVLGQDGDAALALQLVGVHHALDVGLVGAEGAALVQHGVNQGGLSVVHVRDNGDVAKTLAQDKRPSWLGKTACDKANGGLRNRYIQFTIPA